MADEKIIHITDSEFEAAVINSDLPVLVDFWAAWCGPCRAIAPMIDELASEYKGKLTIAKMNVDENPSTPGKFGIRAIPTLILFHNGNVVDQITGAVGKAMIETALAKIIQ